MKPDIVTRLAARVCAALTIVVIAIFPIARSEAADSLAPRIAKAENYPHKPIRVIDPFAAGGATDLMGRLIGQKLTERFGQPVIVDNRTGAGGNVGAEMAAKATPDGYTLFMGVVLALAPGASLYPQLGYDAMKDFAYVTLMAGGSYVLAMTPSTPVKSMAELVVLAKSQPGKIRYGSSGVGGPAHLAGELLKSRAGVDILHVPYKGAAPILAAVVGGEVQLGFSSLAGALPMIKAGRVTPLAVTSAQRAKALPDVPTIAESGFPGYDLTPWYGLLAPAATPSAIVKPLSVEIGKLLQSPDVQAAFGTMGLDATASTPERFRQIMQEAITTAAKIIKDVGIKIE